jgi:hypothetical protein
MKRRYKKLIFVTQFALACSLLCAPVYADAPAAQVKSAEAASEQTDYFVIIESPDDGILLYPSIRSTKPLLDGEVIPNGTILHIDQEVTDASGRTFGHTEYQEEEGYVPLDDCTLIGRQEAIQQELEDGEAIDTDYDAAIDAEEGTTSFYYGPGVKYDVLPGAEEIPNGETFHIYAEAVMPDGSEWAQTNWGDKEAWVPQEDLDQTSKGPKPTAAPETAAISENSKDTETSDNAPDADTASIAQKGTVTPKATTTPKASEDTVDMAKADATPKATATPKASEDTVDMAKADATPEATATPKATATTKPTNTPKATEAAEPTDTAAPTEAAATTDTDGQTDTANATNTPGATATPAATDTPGVTATPAASDTPSAKETLEASVTADEVSTSDAGEDTAETSSTKIETSNVSVVPLLLIGLAVLILLFLLHRMSKKRR